MKSPLLSLFILFNLLTVNMAAAANIFSDELSDQHISQIQPIDTPSDNTHSHPLSADDSGTGSCLDDSGCNHFCHFSAHMAGFVTQIALMSHFGGSTPFILQNESFYSLALEPPSQPPRA